MFSNDANSSDTRYVESLSRSQRRAAGVVYTPQHLVRFILDCANYREEKALQAVRVLDPACGAGAFLVEVLARLAKSLEQQGVGLRSSRGKRELEQVIQAHIVGIDLDPHACVLAREALANRFQEWTGARPSHDAFVGNVVCGDFLGDEVASHLGRGDFDLIVGNPPYVTTTRLTSDAKNRFRDRFKCASGRIDLYQLFMEQSIIRLRDGGRLAFITPNKFMTSQSGSALRSLLLQSGALTLIANFSSHRVFANAATVPCVTVLEKNASQAVFDVLECGAKQTTTGTVPVFRKRTIEQKSLSKSPWYLADRKVQNLADRLTRGQATLESYAARISAGVATGLDSLYVSSENREIEPELTRRAVRGRDIDAFSISDPGLVALIPYTFAMNGREPKLVDIDRYPHAKSVLSEGRKALERRHCIRKWQKNWYDLHDPMPFDIAHARKILVPDIADRNRFALDEGKYLPLHSAYYIILKTGDPECLTAMLNSLPLTFLSRLRAPMVKDGFSRYRRQFLAALPIPTTTTSVQREIARAGFSGDFETVNELTANAFGLSLNDIRTMNSFLRRAPR